MVNLLTTPATKLSQMSISLHVPPQITCQTLEDLHNSDHFPIKTTIITNHSREKPKRRFNFKKAKWEPFKLQVNAEISNKIQSTNINRNNAVITKAIRSAANNHIPQTSAAQNKFVPWWNPLLSKLRQDKFDTLKLYKEHSNIQNFIAYKKPMLNFAQKIKKLKPQA